MRSKERGKGDFGETGSQTQALGQESARGTVKRAPEQKTTARDRGVGSIMKCGHGILEGRCR